VAKKKSKRVKLVKILACCKRSYGLGHEEAFWEAVQICETNDFPKPQWVRDLLGAYAVHRILGRQDKKKEGRPMNWARDGYIVGLVNSLRAQGLSFPKCFKKVRDQLAEDREHLAYPEDAKMCSQLAIRSIARIYEKHNSLWASR
jgi:hypothetical protein